MKSPSILLSIVAAVTMTFGLSTSSVQAVCPPDFNGNNIVDGPDLAMLLTDWNSSNPQYDLNNDGFITGADLAVLIGHWGPCGFGGPPSVGNTLVIDPTKLNLPTGWSAWVVGFANVRGGCIQQTGGANVCYDFAVLTQTSTAGDVVAKFGKATVNSASAVGNVPMIQIWDSTTGPGGRVWGTTTIKTGSTDVLSGAQLQIVVTPTNTPPDGLPWNVSTIPCTGTTGFAQCVEVTQMVSPPYQTNETPARMQLYDIVEFTYIPNSKSTWDLSGVNGFVVPMTMKVTPPGGPELGSIGIQPGISRDRISTAYTTFMTNEGQQGDAFKQLLYTTGVSGCFATPPVTPYNQFCAIPSPYFWISHADNACNSLSSLNTYWDDAIDAFFVPGKTLKVVVSNDSLFEYTGVCSADGNYVFTGDQTTPLTYTIQKPNTGTSASFVFGNIVAGGFPGNDGDLIINSIMEALNRGVALDGFNPKQIPISSATSTDFFLPPKTSGGQPNPMGVATIVTTLPHGIPQVVPPQVSNPYRLNIAGVSVAAYNGIQPANTAYALNVDSSTQFKFQYNLDNLIQNTGRNKIIVDTLTLGTYNSTLKTTSATVKIISGQMPTQDEVVYFHTDTSTYSGQYTVLPPIGTDTFTIQIPGNHTATNSIGGGIFWRMLPAASTGGTVTPYGASTIAWNNFENWYGAPTNSSHQAQTYNTYSKFLHYSTINGTDSRLGVDLPIFIKNQAYGFPLDENPNGPYIGPEVPAKFDGTIKEGSTLNLTLSPWLITP